MQGALNLGVKFAVVLHGEEEEEKRKRSRERRRKRRTRREKEVRKICKNKKINCVGANVLWHEFFKRKQVTRKVKKELLFSPYILLQKIK